MNLLKEMKNHMLLIGIFSLILGVILFVHPGFAIDTLCTIIGIFMIASGGIWLFSLWKQEKKASPIMIPGAILVLAGVYTMMFPQNIVKIINFMFVLVILFHMVQDFYQASLLKKLNDANWRAVSIVGIASGLFALLILWNPFASANALTMIIGVGLIINGLSSLWIAFSYKGK